MFVPLLSLALLTGGLPADAQTRLGSTNAPPASATGTTARTVYRLAEIIEVHHEGNYLAAMKEYNQWIASGGGVDKAIPQDIVEKMYKAAGEGKTAFKTVASLIQNGIELDEATARKEGVTHKKIHDNHNVGMAQMRDGMIDAVISDVAQKNKWIIGRSDSGNVKAGIKSDLDQTFYVFDASDPKNLKRLELKDGEFIEKFKQAWKEKHPGLSIEMLDIASIEGRNRFPDPRAVRGDYLFEFDRVIRDLRATPGAYTTQGAVVQQMQFRALEGILKANPRMFQLYGPVVDKDGKVIKFEKWPFEGDTAVKFMFGTHPELMPGHAFGAALANFLELQHYLHAEKFEVKYHLRTYEDALLVQFLAEEGYGKRAKEEYANMDRQLRNDMNEVLLNRLFPTDPKKRLLHALALDISADLRLLHKNEPHKIASLAGLPEAQQKDPKIQEAKVFEGLAKKLYGTETPTPEQIKNAVDQHRKLASEFCLESTYHTSAEAFRLLLQPDGKGGHHFDIERYRSLLPAMDDAQWAEFKRQQGQGVLLTFLYGLYDLGWSRGNQLVDRLIRQNPREFGRFILERLTTPAEWRALTGPARVVAGDLATAAHSQVAWVLGHEHFEHGKSVHGLLSAGSDGRGRNLARGLGRFAKEAVHDPGNLDGLLQVWRVAIETRGDAGAIQATALDQLCFAVPVAGQIYAATQGGIPGAFLMGAAMYYPPAGAVMLAVSMADSGYAIYDIEYQKPMLGNMADALYRGYVGPSTRSYPGDSPPQFTDAEQKELTQMKAELGRLQGLAEPLRFGQWLLLSDREAQAWHNASRQAEEQLKQRSAALGPRLQTLEAKKTAWEEFSDGAWAGGYTYGAGAQLVQKPCTNHILQFVQPVICYSPSGIVDFKAKFDPAADGPRLAQLEKTVQAAMKNPAADIEQVLTLAEEHADLLLRSNRWSRAQRYLDLAYGRTTNRAGLTKREQAMPVPELIHRIKRDSILPEFGRAGLVDLPKYVDLYLRTHANVLNELHSLGLVDKETIAAALQTGATPDQFIPASVKKELADRLSEDFDRSREMYLKWQTAEKARVEREKIELRNRINAYRAQEAGAALGNLRKEPRYAALFDAIRLANVPRSAPVIKSTIFKLPIKQVGKITNPADEKFKWQLQLSVTADPDLYYPPYEGNLHLLDLNQLRAAVASGVVGKDGDPLLPQVSEQLRELLNGPLGKLKNEEVLVPVVTVFASGMADLSKANPNTVKHLPGYQPAGGQQCSDDDADNGVECADPRGSGPPGRKRIPMGQTVHVSSQTSGAPVIESSSTVTGYGKTLGTYVYFHSPLFLKGPGEGADTAKFRLARGTSPAGPWVTVRERDVRLGIDHAPFYANEGSIARKQSVLMDEWASTNAPARETYDGTQPAWYRVAQVLASGQEVWSAVREPSPPVILLGQVARDTNQLVLTGVSGRYSLAPHFGNSFQLVGHVRLPDQPPLGEGVHVRAQWLGRDWHVFTRPTNAADSALYNRGRVVLDLPATSEPSELVVSSALFGREAHRRVLVVPAYRSNLLAQTHRDFTNRFVTPQRLGELVAVERAKAARELSNMAVAIRKDAEYWPREMAAAAQRGDAARQRDIQKSAPESAARLQLELTRLQYDTAGYGKGYFGSPLAGALEAASLGGRTREAMELWQAAQALYQATWGRAMLEDVLHTNATRLYSPERLELVAEPYTRTRTYREAAALYWQAGDLEASFQLLQAEARLTVEHLRRDKRPLDWPDDLRRKVAWNRAWAGRLAEAVAQWELLEQEALRRYQRQTSPPTPEKAQEWLRNERPYWYLAAKNGTKIENYGPAPAAQQLATTTAASQTRTNAEPSRASAPPPLSLLGMVSDPFKYDQPRVTNNPARDNTAVSGGTLPTPGTSPPRPTPGLFGDPSGGANFSPSPAPAVSSAKAQVLPAPTSPTVAPTPPAPTPNTALPAATSPATTPPASQPVPSVATSPSPPPSTPPVTPAPGAAHPSFTTGSTRMWQGDLRGALADFKIAAEANPNDFEARRLHATMELLAGDPTKARDTADALLRAQPNSSAHQLLRGQAALWLNDTDTARKHLAEAARLDPRLSASLYQQGGQFLQARAHSMAYLSYLSVLYLDPKSGGAYYGLGVSAAQMGLRPQAISAFENYLKADPNSAYAPTARQWLQQLKPGN